MGIEGQLVFGGFMAGIVGHYMMDMNPAVHKLICFGVGILCGMLFALIPALLRAYFHVEDVYKRQTQTALLLNIRTVHRILIR